MLFFGLRRLIMLVVLLGLVGAGYLAYSRARAAPAPSLGAARDAVAAAGGDADARPAPGVYRYAQRGRERFAVGPLQVTRTLPSRALLVVHAAGNGATSLGWRFAGDVEETILIGGTGAGGQRIVERDLTVDLPLAGFHVGGRTQATAWRPGRPKLGKLETVTYDLGGLVVRREARVVRREEVDVGGQPVDTWVIQAKEDLTGRVNGDIAETIWWAPQLGLDVKRTIVFALAGDVAHRLTSTTTLQSVIPERP